MDELTILDLPDEIQELILKRYLKFPDSNAPNLCLVCKRFYDICHTKRRFVIDDLFLWYQYNLQTKITKLSIQVIDVNWLDKISKMGSDLEDLHIKYGSPQIEEIDYIIEKCPNLKKLKLRINRHGQLTKFNHTLTNLKSLDTNLYLFLSLYDQIKNSLCYLSISEGSYYDPAWFKQLERLNLKSFSYVGFINCLSLDLTRITNSVYLRDINWSYNEISLAVNCDCLSIFDLKAIVKGSIGTLETNNLDLLCLQAKCKYLISGSDCGLYKEDRSQIEVHIQNKNGYKILRRLSASNFKARKVFINSEYIKELSLK